MIDVLQLSVALSITPWLGLLSMRPRLLTICVLLFSFVQLGWFSRYFGASAVLNRISFIFGMLLFIRLVVDVSLKRQQQLHNCQILTPVIQLAVYLFVLTIISNLYNGESFILGIYELRYYFLGVAGCFGIYFYLKDFLDVNAYKKFLILLALLQIFFAVVQWISARGGSLRTLDSVTGSFSVYGELVACQTLTLCVVLFEQLTTGKRMLKVHNYFLCVIILIPILLSKSRTATIFVALSIGFSWLLSSMKKKNFVVTIKQAVSVLFLGFVALGLLYEFFWKANYDIRQQFSIDNVIDYYMRDPVLERERFRQGADTSMGRARAITEAVKLICNHPINFLIGYGSGSTANASFLKKHGKYYQEYGPFAGLGRNEYSRTIAEFGFLGLGGFLFFLGQLFRSMKSVGRQIDGGRDLLSIFLFTLAVLSFYASTLSGFFFSLALAFLIAVMQREYDEQGNA